MTYYTTQGDVVTADQIKTAVAEGKARIIYSRAYNHTRANLSLDCEDFDTRGQCYQMIDEQWTAVPTVQQALKVAFDRY